MIWLRRITGLSHRIAWALLFATVTWAAYEYSFPRESWFARVALAVDLPVALSGLVLPFPFQGIDLYFGKSIGHNMASLELLEWHIRASVPGYLFLMYLPNLVYWAYRRMRK